MSRQGFPVLKRANRQVRRGGEGRRVAGIRPARGPQTPLAGGATKKRLRRTSQARPLLAGKIHESSVPGTSRVRGPDE